MAHKLLLVGAICLFTALPASAQDSAGAIEGAVTDPTGAVVPAARVTVKNLGTGLARETTSGADGFYRILALPVGAYVLGVESAKFARFEQQPIQVSVNQTARVDVRLSPAAVSESVTVRGHVQLVDSSSTSLGRVVTGREIVDLPLNGRNFTQLGLLQTGVAPLTAGVATAGGTLRQGQAYAVNGMRPEQNVYLVDGAQNINRMDGGYALKLPVDAIAEFRILTQSAPPEYGGTGGATTSVVTRSGSNQYARQPVRVPPQRRVRRAQLLLGGRRAAQAAPVRRDGERAGEPRPPVFLRLLRRVPQPAGHHDDRDGANAAASGRATSPISGTRC